MILSSSLCLFLLSCPVHLFSRCNFEYVRFIKNLLKYQRYLTQRYLTQKLTKNCGPVYYKAFCLVDIFSPCPLCLLCDSGCVGLNILMECLNVIVEQFLVNYKLGKNLKREYFWHNYLNCVSSLLVPI